MERVWFTGVTAEQVLREAADFIEKEVGILYGITFEENTDLCKITVFFLR